MARFPRRSRAVLIRQLLTQVLNVIATALTLITGIKDNPIVVGVTGRYKFIRSRLQDGSINYDIARMEAIKPESFVPFAEVGKSYSFFSTPDRNPATMGLDRSLCLRVNSMNSTTYAVYFDDYWGKGPRRTTRFVNSISAPNCQLINFRPAWYKSCINDVNKGNQTGCNQYVVDHFKELQDNVLVQVNNDKSDFGEVGMPVLKCVRRPDRPFDFNMDLNLQHSYWAGNIFHFELQTSVCRAKPLLRTPDWEWTLFQVVSVDQNAKTAIAVAESGVVGQIVTPIYGIVAISMLAIGIYAAITRNRTVKYLPDKVRYAENRRLLRYLFPFMNAAVLVTDQARAVISFKGSIMTASNFWLSHWLYILVSIVNAVVHLRMAYVKLNLGTWMMSKKSSFPSFLFICSAFTTISWLICAAHTAMCIAFKLFVRVMITLHVLPRSSRAKIDWYIDGTAMFSSFRLYNVLLGLYYVFLLTITGKTTLLTRQVPDKLPMFGGTPNIASFWGSELVGDLVVIIPIIVGTSVLMGFLLLQTRYRYVVNNSVMRELQRRYFFVGWDAFTAIQVLDMDPYDPALVDGDVALARCSLGSLVQLLYQSGPSSFVRLAGDYLFVGSGFSKDPVEFYYPTKTAKQMGIFNRQMSGITPRVAAVNASVDSSDRRDEGPSKAVIRVESREKENGETSRSIFEHHFKLVAEGYLSRVFLLNGSHPGMLTRNEDTGMREFVIRDGLSFMAIDDVKALLGKDAKLYIH